MIRICQKDSRKPNKIKTIYDIDHFLFPGHCAIITTMEWIVNFDFAILDWIQLHLRNAFLDVVMPLITMLGDHGIFFIAVGLLCVCFRRSRRCGFFLLAALLMGLLICNITLKPLVARIRPYELNPGVDLLIEAPTDFSYPSGHTNASFVFATVIFCVNKKCGIPAFLLAFLIAFSRLYLYVHYPTDVLGGILFGMFAGWITVKLLSRLLQKYPRLQQFIPPNPQKEA